MLSVEQALERCLTATQEVVVESVRLWDADDRVLAEDIVCSHPLPHWDNSAMDGFAVRAADTGMQSPDASAASDCDADQAGTQSIRLRVLETIAAGSAPTQSVQPGTCSRIMTGAPLPQGADSVVMREDTSATEDAHHILIHRTAVLGQHIRRAGEEIAQGDTVLRKGQTLTPARVGLCASVGRSAVGVARQPRVAIVSTGDEVMPPGQTLGPGQIWSSNTLALAGLVRRAGAIPIDCGNAPDTLEGTRATFQAALKTGADLLVSTGGVSVGDFDVVRQALEDVGVKMDFWKVWMKPGKPLAFGSIDGRPAFGLPGNPVSCLVNFMQFVRPVIRRSLGDPTPFLPVQTARFVGTYRKRTGRAELVRVSLQWVEDQLWAESTGAQGSGQVSSMARAHGLALLPPACPGLEDGQSIHVQVLDQTFARADHPGYPWPADEAP